MEEERTGAFVSPGGVRVVISEKRANPITENLANHCPGFKRY